MDEAAFSDPALDRLRRELEAIYGARLKRALLYGSRARGDHGPDSDYDVLVVLDGPLDRWEERKRLSALSAAIGLETAGKVILSLKPLSEEQMQERTGFMFNVRREARAI
jgi:uncharacterized protein